jgi:D-alanyl-D-alanine dipeptidase
VSDGKALLIQLRYDRILEVIGDVLPCISMALSKETELIMKKITIIIIVLVFLLGACSAQSSSPQTSQTQAATPTQQPSQTQAVVVTPSPSPTQIATSTPVPEPTPTPYVKLNDPTSSLTVREGPGTGTGKIGSLRDGDPVNIIEFGDVWHKIEFEGKEAYVFAQYVKNVPIRYAYVPELVATVDGKTYTSKMVDVRAIVPDLKIWLIFASSDNYMNKVLYPAGACLLQESTALKLAKAEAIFRADGYQIRLYDGYRPFSVSVLLYEEIRDGRFVANPNRSPSNHNRGAAVDITLERIDTGEQIPMPSFMMTLNISSYRSLPDIYKYEEGSDEYNAILEEFPDILKYPRRSSTAIKNMNYLTRVMKSCGFTTISTEWWHFADRDKATFMVLDYDLANDIQWIPEDEYEAFMAEEREPLTDLPDYVVFPEKDEPVPISLD